MENGGQSMKSLAKEAARAAKRSSEANLALRFKIQHFFVTLFFLWIFLLHFVGIFFFTKGFLLTRLVLERKSECSVSPLEGAPPVPSGQGCWYPKQFDKAVFIIIDALRYDFTIPQESSEHYHNALTFLHETAVKTPENAILLPFIADPPTATLQRLKGLTTGTLPTFVDIGSNFAGTAIEEDNILNQLLAQNRTLVHLGDDTWHSLFPGYFDANLTHAYDSFNVWDLHTVDNGVTEHLLPLLQTPSRWDICFGHYLGVDHAGHRYGPDHPAMNAKLLQMDDVLRSVVRDLPEDTLLIVMGDHGMDAKGDHGGESDDEVEAALWMYSKRAIFGYSDPAFKLPPKTAKERPVAQIDIVPTLSLLLGLPIPFNNLGAPIAEAFLGQSGSGWDKLASVQAITAAQIKRYQGEYAQARGLTEDETSAPNVLWDKAMKLWRDASAARWKDSKQYRSTAEALSEYQKANLKLCKSLWASFDIPSMLLGIGILALTLFILVGFAGNGTATVQKLPGILYRIGIGMGAGTVPAVLIYFAGLELGLLETALLGISIGSLLGYGLSVTTLPTLSPIPRSIWTWMAVIMTVSQSVGFASNSYTIWEDEILLFFLGTFGVMVLASSWRQESAKERALGVYHASLFLILTRISSLSRLCREEQMPACRSTYYASATASTAATWHLFIPYTIAILLPTFIRAYYEGTNSYHGSAVFWIGFAFRLGLLGSAVYWTLNAADDGDWLPLGSETLGTVKVLLAQVVLVTALVAGTTTFVWAPPPIRVETPDESAPDRKAVNVLGLANLHGSRYALLLTSWLLAVILVQKPMGGGAIALMAWQLLSLLEIVGANGLRASPIAPVAIALLGSFYFFKTGHQATPASIQWDSAFLALKTLRYPWSPLLVLLNTYGAQILAAVAVPLVVLWRRPPQAKGLLAAVSQAIAAHLAYHAVISLATTMWAAHLRRHLMLYRIFSPRFMSGAMVLVVVELVSVLVALLGFRINTVAIAEIFGWASEGAL